MQQDLYQIIIPLFSIPFLLLAYWRLNLKRLKIYHSPLLGKIEIFKKYNGEKALTINSYIQGISIEKKSAQSSYWFYVAEQAVKFCQNKNNSQILMLGLGANTVSNFISQLNPSIHQTIIEIDKYIIDACRQYFGLDKLPNYQIIKADAYKLVDIKNIFDQKFDVIVVDIFTGNPPYISLKSNQPPFIEKLLPWLKRDGMIVFNRPGHTEKTRSDSRELQQYLNTLFKTIQLFDIKDPRGYRNNVITGDRLII